MNIHPIFVHFPIALFTLYAFFEVIRLPVLIRQAWYFYIKAVLVITGSATSFMAVITGNMAKKFMAGHPALQLHERFGFATTIIFVVIAVAYIFAWKSKESGLENFGSKLVNSKWVIILAVLGFACLTITGGLGGAMVYGPDADPLFRPIYRFLIN